MTDRPLLWFPQPEPASRTKLTAVPGKTSKPSHERQGERVALRLTQLQQAFEARRAELVRNAAGVDPEQVLVIETVGAVEDFSKAVKKIEGLEWLGEIEIDNLPPDEDFHNLEHPEKPLKGRLYLVLTNQQALTELLSLWRRYKDQDDPKMKFDTGLTKFRDVFCHLWDIRRWGPTDRLVETGVLDIWREELNDPNLQNRPVRFEAELWYRESADKRAESENTVLDLVNALEGQVITVGTVPGIRYHAILAELPANRIQEIIDAPETELVKCDNIMFFRPVGQMTSGETPSNDYAETVAIENNELPMGPPVLAILDGLPYANHQCLEGRIIVEDPDGWAEDYSASERMHGTTMASLAIHGDLSEGAESLSRPIYMRPIMRPDVRDFRRPRLEVIPTDALPVDLIHRSVKRMFEGEGEHPASAPTVKIINLSVGDYSRAFMQSMSPLARLLDWLSSKYNVLFIISAGNQLESIPLGITLDEFEQLAPDAIEQAAITAILMNARSRSILSPSESINGITVGAIHFDAANNAALANRFDPFHNTLPSPISPFGSGYRRAIKPDIVFHGGRQWYAKPYIGRHTVDLNVSGSMAPPGHKVAIPGQAASTDSTGYTRGTSNATALISRAAVHCYETLSQITEHFTTDGYEDKYTAPLIKAMITHGCNWGSMGQRLVNIISQQQHIKNPVNFASRWIGYGVPDINRVLECTEQRATILGYGELSDEQAHVFKMPLPPSLSSIQQWRRLTVTLAWFSPVQPSNQKYRSASMWFEASNPIANQRREAASGNSGWQAVRRGTLQHEIFEGDWAQPFVDGDNLSLKINCRKDASAIDAPIPYGIIVSFEVREGVQLPIYQEISEKIRIQPAVQVRQ